MKINIVLHGKLEKIAGRKVMSIDVQTPQQAVSFLIRAFKGMRQALRRGSYRFSLTSDNRSAMLSDNSNFNILLSEGIDTINLVPIETIYGKRFLGVVLGVVLIGVGLFVPVSNALVPFAVSLIGIGSGLVLSGVASLLTPIPNLNTRELEQGDRPEDRQSTLFSGATNRSAKGVAVPVLYGRFLCGSNIISESVRTQEVL